MFQWFETSLQSPECLAIDNGKIFCCYAVAKSCLTLFVSPLAIAHQASLSMGFSRQEYWSGLPFAPPGDLPRSGIKPESPALACGFLTTEPSEKPLMGEYKQAKLIVYWPLLRNQGAYHKQVVLLANCFPLFKSYSIVTILKWKLCFWQMSFKIYCFISGNCCCRRIHLVPPGGHFAANSSRQVHWEADSISEMAF